MQQSMRVDTLIICQPVTRSASSIFPNKLTPPIPYPPVAVLAGLQVGIISGFWSISREYDDTARLHFDPGRAFRSSPALTSSERLNAAHGKF
jgi:hypothetical protein